MMWSWGDMLKFQKNHRLLFISSAPYAPRRTISRLLTVRNAGGNLSEGRSMYYKVSIFINKNSMLANEAELLANQILMEKDWAVQVVYHDSETKVILEKDGIPIWEQRRIIPKVWEFPVAQLATV